MGALGAQLGLGLLDSMYTPQVTEGLHVDDQGNYTDAQGNPASPYVKPGFFSRVISPTARSISNIDTESSLQPLQATRENNIRNTIGGQNFSKMKAAGVTGQGFSDLPDDVGFMSNPSMSPSGYSSQGTSILNNRGGMQGLQSGTDITQAQTMLEAAKRLANRQPVLEATQDANAATGLRSATSLAPTLTDNEIARAKGESERMPLEQGLIGKKLGVENTNTDLAQMFADSQHDLWPVNKDTLYKNTYAENQGATYRPLQSPLSTIMSSTGTETLGKNPVGINSQIAAMSGMPGGDNILPTTSSITTPSGRTYIIPKSIQPSVQATSQTGSSPSTRPTVASTAAWQHQPQTTNVADTQREQFRPLVGGNINTYPMPSSTEDVLKNAWDVDAPMAKKGAIHIGHAMQNLMDLINAKKASYPNW